MRREITQFIYGFMACCLVTSVSCANVHARAIKIHELRLYDRKINIHKLNLRNQGHYDDTLANDSDDRLKILTSSGSSNDDTEQIFDLNSLIGIAIRNNQMLEVARQQKIQRKSQLGLARADYLPQLTAAGRYFYTERKDSAPDNSTTTPSSGATTGDVENDDILHGSVNFSQLIYDFGKTTGAISVGKANLLAATAQLQRQIDHLVFQVKEAYFKVLEKKRLIDIAQETVKSFEQHLHQAKIYYKAGVRTKIDVINAEVELANANLAQLRAEYGLKTAKVALEQVMGVQPNNGRYQVSSDKVTPDNLMDSIPPAPDDLMPLLARAEEIRPDLISLNLLQEAAEANIAQITGDYWPKITAEASYNDYETDLDLYKDSWEAGLALRWDLFSGMRTRNAATEAKSRLIEAKAQLQDQKLTVVREVTDSYLKSNEHFQSVQIALKTLELAKENVELAGKRYKSGAFSVIEFNDAQLNLTKIRNELVMTYYGYLTALAGVEYAVGASLDNFAYDQPQTQ